MSGGPLLPWMSSLLMLLLHSNIGHLSPGLHRFAQINIKMRMEQFPVTEPEMSAESAEDPPGVSAFTGSESHALALMPVTSVARNKFQQGVGYIPDARGFQDSGTAL